MSTEPDLRSDSERPSGSDPMASVATYTYDACGPVISHPGDANTVTSCQDTGPALPSNAAQPPRSAVTPAQPLHAQTFEFRLSGSEAQEQCVTLAARRGRVIVATRCVRAYLTRTGAASAASSVIGGLEVHTEVRDGNLVCGAALSDFGPGDLVVVQVEVAVYKTGNHK